MKRVTFVIVLLLYFCAACRQPKSCHHPQNITVLNLDQLSQSLECEKVPLKIIYDRTWHETKAADQDKYIKMIGVLAEGPDSSIYVLDSHRHRVVQLSKDGTFLRTVIPGGKMPGHLHDISLTSPVHRSDNGFYITDNSGMRLQVFDLYGRFIRVMTQIFLDRYQFALGKNGTLLYLPSLGPSCPLPRKASEPPPPIAPQLLYLAVLADTLGHEIRKIGPIRSDDSLVYVQDFRLPYSIVATANTPDIWFVFKASPCIRRYDYQGNFLEEIRFESQRLAAAVEEFSYSTEPNFSMLYIQMLTNAYPLENGDLILSILSIGNVRLAVRGSTTSIVKKYELFLLDDAVFPLKHHLQLRYLHGTKYAYVNADRGLLLKESR